MNEVVFHGELYKSNACGCDMSGRRIASRTMRRQFNSANGRCFTVNLTRETARRELVTHRGYNFNGAPVYSCSTSYDLIGRPTNAVDSLTSVREWLYNCRSELAAVPLYDTLTLSPS